ncbi:MAG: O-antigen ligase family protein [bacterium]
MANQAPALRRWLQSESGLALTLVLFFLALVVLWQYSGRGNILSLGLAGVIAAGALLQWPILGALYISFSIFGRVASFVPGIDTAIVVLTLLAYMARKLLDKDPTWRFPASARWALLFIAWLAASITWAENAREGMQALVMYLKSFLIFLLVLEAAQDYRRVLSLIYAALAGAVFATLIAVYTGYRFFFSGAAAELSRVVTIQTTRLYGQWFDANYFALALLALIGVAFGLWRSHTARAWKLAAGAGFASVVLGIVLTLSRAGMLSAFIAFLFLLRAERRRLRILLFVGCIIALVLLCLPIGLWERIETLASGQADASLQIRGRLLQGGLEMAMDAFPFGVGLGNYFHHSLSYVKMSHPMLSHNSYVDLMAEAGIVAVFLFAGFIISLFQTTLVARRFDPNALDRNLAIGLRISLIAFLIGATFLSAAVFGPLWWLAGIIAAKAVCDEDFRGQPLTASNRVM